MGVYIKGMEMPGSNPTWVVIHHDGTVEVNDGNGWTATKDGAIEVKAPHGRLGDLDALKTRMYHEAFETDSDMQRWESGCWIRYRLFERTEEAAPTIIEAEGKDND